MGDYYEIDRMSFSGLKQAARSRAHYEHWKNAKSADSPAMALGSYVDALLLDTAALPGFSVRPETYTDEKGNVKPWTLASNTCKSWMRENGGKQILTTDQVSAAQKMARSVRGHEEAALILGSEKLQTQKDILWTDHDSGIDLKSKLDIWEPESGTLADLKTTTDASPSVFGRAVASYHYHAQLAMYSDALQFIGEKRPERYLLIVVESAAPHCTAVYSINPRDIETGRRWYKNILEKFAAETNNKQAGYSKYAEPLQLPSWIDYEV